MKAKPNEKHKAIQLRKHGLSYREILEQIPVAKSTLSLWLRSVGLSKRQKQRLTEKKLEAGLRGSLARHRQRVERSKEIREKARKEISSISKKELWLMGIMLYWTEGAKEKPHSPGTGIDFGNSDPIMTRLFLKWLIDICKVEKERIHFNIYIHENRRKNSADTIHYWSRNMNLPKKHFQKIYFKKHKPKTNRKNIGDSYYGLLRIKVRASSELNRRITGWIEGIDNYYCGVV